MLSNTALTIISVTFTFLGTVLLAFAANKYFKAVDNSFLGAENNIQSLADLITNQQNAAPLFVGFKTHRLKGMKNASMFTYLGLIFIGIGIVFQLLTLNAS